MKTTIVPAQITTVEDKIAGNLSFTQLLLLIVPVFLAGLVFSLLPPFMRLSAWKLVVVLCGLLISGVMAIRIKGKIILEHLAMIIRYNLRDRFYIYDKNDDYLRSDQVVDGKEQSQEEETVSLPATYSGETAPSPDLVRLESVFRDPRSSLHFKTKKGGLYVFIKEIE